MICSLLKNFPGQDILDISNFLFGKYFKIFVGILFICYLLLTCSYLLRDFCEGLKIIYFTRTHIYYILAIFILTIWIIARLGEKAVINSNMKNLVPQKIFPILGYGVNKTFITGVENLYSFGNIGILYFLPSYLKDVKKLKKISIISIVTSCFYLIITLTGLLVMFPFTLSNHEIMPLYLSSRYIEFGKFFQRVDSVFLLIWIWTMILHLSILLMLSAKVVQKISIIRNRNLIISVFCLIILGISIIPKNLVQINFFETNIYKYMVLYFILGAGTFILIFANLKRKLKNKSKNKEETLLEN